MRKRLIVTLILTVAVALAGCSVHYTMDHHIDKSTIVGSNSPNALKVYISEYRFNDGPGVKRVTAEGEISLWIKKAVLNALKDVRFLSSPQDADISINTQKVELGNQGGEGFKVNSRLYLLIANRPIKITVRHPTELTIMNDRIFNNFLLGLTELLRIALHDASTNGEFDISKLPSEIKADIETKGGLYAGLYDFKRKQKNNGEVFYSPPPTF